MLYNKHKNSSKIGRKSMQNWGKKGVSFLPLMIPSQMVLQWPSLAWIQHQNFKTSPLEPQEPKEGETLCVCVQ